MFPRSGVQVGQVSTRANARIHLDLHGLASCGAGRGLILPGTTRDITTTDPARICRRCRYRIQKVITAASARSEAAEGTAYTASLTAALSRIGRALDTPAQRAADDAARADLAARVLATMRASGAVIDPMAATAELAPVVMALPRWDRPRTWATMRQATTLGTV